MTNGAAPSTIPALADPMALPGTEETSSHGRLGLDLSDDGATSPGDVPWDELGDASYRHTAPSRLVRELDEGG